MTHRKFKKISLIATSIAALIPIAASSANASPAQASNAQASPSAGLVWVSVPGPSGRVGWNPVPSGQCEAIDPDGLQGWREAENESTAVARLWQWPNCTGDSATLFPGDSTPDTGWNIKGLGGL